MTLRVLLAFSFALFGCRADQPAELAKTARCRAAQPEHGERLRVEQDASIWFRAAGDPTKPVVVYLHGGPGYNAYDFEHAVGHLLEPQLRMVYMDQRGCGRSWFAAPPERFGLTNTVGDIERLREHLGVARIYLLAHSFGGLVALEYDRAHHDHVAGLILVETTADLAGALSHQMRALVELAPTRFPAQREALAALADSGKPLSVQVGERYQILPRLQLQRALYFATDEGQAKNEAWDEESGLMACDSGPVARKYVDDGELDSAHPSLMQALRSPAILFGGRQSHAIGGEILADAAARWRIPIRWFEHSGHFIFVEEPDAFSKAVIDFISEADTRSLPASAE